MLRTIVVSQVALAVLLCLSSAAPAQEKNSDEKMFDKVMSWLLKNDTVIAAYPSRFAFPPKAFIKAKSAKELNASASASKFHGADFDAKSGLCTLTPGRSKPGEAGRDWVATYPPQLQTRLSFCAKARGSPTTATLAVQSNSSALLAAVEISQARTVRPRLIRCSLRSSNKTQG